MYQNVTYPVAISVISKEIVIRHDFDLKLMSNSELNTSPTYGSSPKQITKIKNNTNILKSNKSRSHFFGTSRRRPRRPQGEFKPIRNMADCTERLEVRGAADGTIWKWCSNVLKIDNKGPRMEDNGTNEGLLKSGNNNFPCPLMSHNLNIPVNPPVDPTYKAHVTTEANISQCKELEGPATECQRYSLWSKDFSGLYPVYKVSAHILNERKNK